MAIGIIIYDLATITIVVKIVVIVVMVDIIEQHTQSPPYRVIVVLRDEKYVH